MVDNNVELLSVKEEQFLEANKNFDELLYMEEKKFIEMIEDSDVNNIIDDENTEYILPNIIDFDKFVSYIPNVVFINRISLEKNYIEEITSAICYNSKRHSLVPSCECENLMGEFYKVTSSDQAPIICPLCNTAVKDTVHSEIKNDIWIDIPPIFKGGVMHPVIFDILTTWLKVGRSKTSYLHLILDPDSTMPPDLEGVITGRGFNYLYNNFDYLMDFFANIYPPTAKKSKKFLTMKLLEKYRDRAWCTKLPILSSILQPITKKGVSLQFVSAGLDPLMKSIIDLIDINITKRTTTYSLTQAEKTMYKVYMAFLEYKTHLQEFKLGGKPGVLRQHVYGTRLHFTFRSVIVPIIEIHQGDELHVPWKIGLNTYKHYVMSFLMNRKGYTIIEAYNKIIRAFSKYDHEIDIIFQILIKECPWRGLPVLFNRNPSLNTSAIQLLFITKIKPALKNIDQVYEFNKMLDFYVNDETIGFSALIAKDPNADYDGDELNGVPIVEMNSVIKFLPLHPMNRMISSITGEMGTSITVPYPLFVTMNNWLEDET